MGIMQHTTLVLKTQRTIRILLISILGSSCTTTPKEYLSGEALYNTVEKYVSLGEHRTGTSVDLATSAWLEDELRSVGYEVNYTSFTLHQFFFEKGSVSLPKENTSFDAFPFWYVNDSIPLQVEAPLVTNADDLHAVKNKIVLLNFSFGEQGQSAQGLRNKIQALAEAGAKGIVGYKENEADEIVAFNAPKAGNAWPIPIVVVKPSSARTLIAHDGAIISIDLKGTFEDVIARNVYGTIGNGEKFIVVSTPISGWFTCGGERGPGVAVWLALAKWAAEEKLPYTFVFTGNTGHELGFWGADEFLHHHAPAIEKTKLWIHLGAGLATLQWRSTPEGLVRENQVDGDRNFFYTTTVQSSFEKAFSNIAGQKFNTEERNGGELLHVVKKGYPHALGVSYAHPFFHAPGDDASKTSPEILEEITVAFKHFIEDVAKN
jgi:hypothetical protein